MFEKELQRRLERIFGVCKVTYLAADAAAPEQDCIFVEVDDVASRMQASGGGRQTCKVTGSLLVFSQAERTTYGFFRKRAEQADPADTRGLYIGPETNAGTIENVCARRVAFQFLYDSQYDPDRGEMTSLETTLTLEE
jgi:hypothetical protein